MASAQSQNLPGGIRIPTGGGGGGGGAVLDDSTKNIYGPTTTSIFYEDDILNNRDSTRYHVDTNMTYFHRWTFVDRSWNRLVDLGNLGTAARPLFFEPRTDVGRQLGFRSYSPYSMNAEDVRYYDTKSPYTDMYFIMGGHDRDMLRFGFTQNINPRMNFGFRIQRFVSQRQYGSYAARGSQAALARNWNFLIHGSYFSENKKYVLLTHFRSLSHSVVEQGGVVMENDSTTGIIVDRDYEGPQRLSANAKSSERRAIARLYHQYRLVNGFQLYHQVEYQGTTNRYKDTDTAPGVTSLLYFPLIKDKVGRDLPIDQTITHHLVDNRIGIKGVFSGYNYRAYFRSRAQSMTGRYYVTDSTSGTYGMQRLEPILGVWMQYHLRDSTWKLTANGEHVLARDLILNGQLDIPWAKLGFRTALTSPDLLMSQYKNAYLFWNNPDDTLKLSKTITVSGAFPIKTRTVSFTPEVEVHRLEDYLYYGTDSRPAQHRSTFHIMRIGFDAAATLKRWHFRTLAYYTKGFDNEVIRIPRFFVSGEASFSFTYAKAMDVQLGIAASYNTSYFADGYMPITQQFHIQNYRKVGNYPVADVFANLRIKRVRLLLRYSHLNRGWGAPAEGYLPTPGYLALKPAFSIGVSWPLFD